MNEKYRFEPPVFDLRVVSLVLCTFLSGTLAAAHTGSHIAVHGSGNFVLSLAVSVLRYVMLGSLCIASARVKPMLILLFLYDAVCAVTFGYYTYSFYTQNSVVLLAVILPMLVYCYVMTVFTSAALICRNEKPETIAKTPPLVYNNEKILRIFACRWRLIAAGVFLEGIIAPCL